jgi:UPF0755 protein
MTRNPLLMLTVAAAAFVAAAVIIASYFVARTPGDAISRPAAVSVSPGTETVAYTVAKGRSAADIGKDLQRLGVIASGAQFELLVSVMGLQDRLSAGDYELPRGSSAAAAIQALTVKESVPTLKVLFPEGLRIEEMAEVAEKAGFGTRQQFLDAVAAAKLPPELQDVVPAGAGLQGYLFPDTYILPVGSTPAQLVDLMLKTFVRRFTPEMRASAEAHGLSVHQVVTLASIVEREAQVDAERPLMAGVFLNRLEAGDLLGADPTVQFAAALDPASVQKFGWWKKELTIDDLENPSKYNTRLFPGLPPGPITNPGLAALEAAATPSVTKMYYFVADAKKNDGSHVFAETLAEHERNRARVGSP